jgi:hypothetical protein
MRATKAGQILCSETQDIIVFKTKKEKKKEKRFL